MNLHERLAALPPEKRALLEQRLRRGPAAAAAVPESGASATSAPLSFAQQRLWVLEQIEPGHTFYHLPLAVRLRGPVSSSMLERALNEVVRRHEALRTTFVSVDGQPALVVASELGIPIELVDLRGTARADREAAAAALMGQEVQRPFDLTRGPLLRAMLLRLDENDHTLLLTMHHIVSDGWSLGILQRELSALYAAFLAGRSSPLPELPMQYSGFAVWQREQLRGETLERLLSYWKQKLAGAPPLLELPTDRPRPPAQVFRGAAFVVPVPAATVQALQTLIRRRGATLFMGLLAAFKVLLARYSGGTDIVAGSPVANRTRRQTEGLIGFFVNTLVLRTDLSGDPTFAEVLARVRDVTLEALAHQDLPFDKLVEELQPARDLSHNPLFQVAFGLQNADAGSVAAGGRPSYVGGGTSKFDLTLSAAETAQGLDAAFEYNTELLDERTVASMARHYLTLLDRAAAQPERRVSELLVLEGEERRRAIAAAAGPRTGAPSTASIVEWCGRHAKERPNEIAIEFSGHRLTWHELNSRVDQLAQALRAKGVTHSSLVAVCLERSLELPIALLAVLRAGAAFVPLDPALPPARRDFILRDTGAQLLDLLPGDATSHFTSSPASPPLPDDPAYIIYTSGSTGEPKGVVVCHRGLSNVADAQRALFGLPPGTRVLQFSSLSFDASVFDLALALSCGGTLVMAPQGELMPGPPLLRTLRNERINALVVPPSSLAALPAAMLPELTTIIAAGEELPQELVTRWGAGRRFFNAYGPTEITIWATLAECGEGSVAGSIGRPIPNTQVYVLDEHLEPVPRGVPGEIVVGGIGVARGYHRRAALTAERYVADPFASDPNSRMYRTGDRGRILPNGEIHYLGRLDQQLKFRGYRIEPGEIETALLAHPDVREAVVVRQRTPSGETRIVAHCVTRDGAILDAAALRAHLRGTLPEYMIPSSFRMTDQLPRTASGKADRTALMLLPMDADVAAERIAARSPEEAMLAAIWCDVLELPSVGIHDSFFEVGGHSLLAARAISRINDSFDLVLPLRTIFEKPTVAAFAEMVMQARTERPA